MMTPHLAGALTTGMKRVPLGVIVTKPRGLASPLIRNPSDAGAFVAGADTPAKFTSTIRIGISVTEPALLLTTDGVTEAADAHDEEFGNERVVASARAARRLGAQGIRTRILDEVTRFCNGNFHDDASLIVVTVD